MILTMRIAIQIPTVTVIQTLIQTQTQMKIVEGILHSLPHLMETIQMVQMMSKCPLKNFFYLFYYTSDSLFKFHLM